MPETLSFLHLLACVDMCVQCLFVVRWLVVACCLLLVLLLVGLLVGRCVVVPASLEEHPQGSLLTLPLAVPVYHLSGRNICVLALQTDTHTDKNVFKIYTEMHLKKHLHRHIKIYAKKRA